MDILEDKIVKTKKEHKCFGCGRTFPVNSKLQLLVYVDNGDFSRTYWCPTCRKYWDINMIYDDSIFFGELKSEDPKGWEEIRKQVEAL